MSSDTESTVCDPRLEVAPEPQVPKGPGQIRRVPQLFTATARSTPVVPPQVQQETRRFLSRTALQHLDHVDKRKKERKKTDNPREGWEDGTPPPHRDFKERCVMR